MLWNTSTSPCASPGGPHARTAVRATPRRSHGRACAAAAAPRAAREGWERQTYWCLYGGSAFLVACLCSAPNTSIKAWGRDEAEARNIAAIAALVGETFDSVVLDTSRDVLVELYAPWCAHCKGLAPKLRALADRGTLSGARRNNSGRCARRCFACSTRRTSWRRSSACARISITEC